MIKFTDLCPIIHILNQDSSSILKCIVDEGSLSWSKSVDVNVYKQPISNEEEHIMVEQNI